MLKVQKQTWWENSSKSGHPDTKILMFRNLITDYSTQDLMRGKETKFNLFLR